VSPPAAFHRLATRTTRAGLRDALVMRELALIGPALRALRRRLLLLGAFSLLFLFAAAGLRVLAPRHEGHLEIEQLFQVGGYPLVSGLLLFGWLLGRFPLVATLVLAAGVFSDDRAHGYTRVYAARRVSLLRLYGVRLAVLLALAFVLSAVLLPAFDILLLGQWAGPGTLVVSAAYVLTYGSLVAVLSIWTRGDAWIALALAITAILWHSLRQGGILDAAPTAAREIVSLILPPHGALFVLENAFAALEPIPWAAFGYVVAYAAVLLLLAGLSLLHREI
jgi:hypothetical protein